MALHILGLNHNTAPVEIREQVVFAGEAVGPARERELERIRRAACLAATLGLECHAGHGLSFETVSKVAAIAEIRELNIGHFLVGEAIFCGLDSAVKRMRALMDKARAEATGRRTA